MGRPRRLALRLGGVLPGWGGRLERAFLGAFQMRWLCHGPRAWLPSAGSQCSDLSFCHVFESGTPDAGPGGWVSLPQNWLWSRTEPGRHLFGPSPWKVQSASRGFPDACVPWNFFEWISHQDPRRGSAAAVPTQGTGITFRGPRRAFPQEAAPTMSCRPCPTPTAWGLTQPGLRLFHVFALGSCFYCACSL